MLTIAAYSRVLGVHPQTLRRWEREGRSGLVAPLRTAGNHRRYPVPTAGKVTVGYARVSCHDQKEDLPRQINRLVQYAADQPIVIIKDIGSGLNCNQASESSWLCY
jgi:putative resolvase